MQIFSTSTIFYPPYLISAFIITMIWIKKNSSMKWRESFSLFFSKNIWLSKESLVDFLCCIFVLIILKKWMSPFEDWLFTSQLNNMNHFLVTSWSFKLPPLAEGILATLVTMIAIDAASYFTHRWMHSSKILWKTHKFHHSITQLNFMSTYRQNPIEVIILNVFRTLAAAIGLAFFHWFFPDQTPVITIQGLGAGFFIYMFTVNLHHSHIPVHYPKFVCYILISPHVHHLHHSTNSRHVGKNFGVVFSIWDRFFGTYHEENVKIGELRFGNKISFTQTQSN
ncbi:MAG: sterol desaturase family protein [Rhizobacter sp.]|nr:sterol desaturase family protein [Bacteriovorax sp.]